MSYETLLVPAMAQALCLVSSSFHGSTLFPFLHNYLSTVPFHMFLLLSELDDNIFRRSWSNVGQKLHTTCQQCRQQDKALTKYFIHYSSSPSTRQQRLWPHRHARADSLPDTRKERFLLPHKRAPVHIAKLSLTSNPCEISLPLNPTREEVAEKSNITLIIAIQSSL